MFHYCTHCNYGSKHKWVLRRHITNKHPNNATVQLETWRQQPIQVEEMQPNYEQPNSDPGDKQPIHQQIIQEHENLKHNIVTPIKEEEK